MKSISEQVLTSSFPAQDQLMSENELVEAVQNVNLCKTEMKKEKSQVFERLKPESISRIHNTCTPKNKKRVRFSNSNSDSLKESPRRRGSSMLKENRNELSGNSNCSHKRSNKKANKDMVKEIKFS